MQGIQFGGAFITGRVPYSGKANVSEGQQQLKLLKNSQAKADELVRTGQAERAHAYLSLADGKAADSPKEVVGVVLTDADADPLLKLSELKCTDLENYGGSIDVEQLPGPDYSRLWTLRREISDATQGLQLALEQMGFLKASQNKGESS